MSNIIQAEFFLVDTTNAQSIEDLIKDCKTRLIEGLELTLHGIERGPGIKTVIRFYDQGNLLTALALQAKVAADEHDEIIEQFASAGWLRRKLVIRQAGSLKKLKAKLSDDCRLRTYIQLHNEIKALNNVAIEKSDHHFRLARPDELHELYESVRNSNSMWLFIFEPND